MTYAAGRFQVKGVATYATLGELSRELLLQSVKRGELVLDLGQLEEYDSHFVATLAACQRNKSRHKGAVVIESAPQRLESMLGVYGLVDAGIVLR
jgi:ABC-type transporter Mla MlaB component